jgi:hypothetical protein
MDMYSVSFLKQCFSFNASELPQMFTFLYRELHNAIYILPAFPLVSVSY